MIRVRNALYYPTHAADDAPQVAALLHRVIAALPFYNDEAKHTEIALLSADFLRAAIEADANAVLVATSNAVPIGVCVSRHDDGPVWLSWYLVDAAWRGRGVGLMLLKALIETRTAEGINKIWCDCRTDNPASLALLQQVGFQPLCTVRQHWHGQDYVLLERFLNNGPTARVATNG